MKSSHKNKAVFLDRDGVLNVDKHYLYKISDLEWIPGAIEAVVQLSQLGWKIIVVTNQSGIARGYYTEDDVMTLHHYMAMTINNAGGKIDKFIYCPYLKGGKISKYDKNSIDRKPAPGMILKGIKAYDLEPTKCFLIGDKDSDMEAAERAGMPGFLFKGGRLDTFVLHCLTLLKDKKDFHV